MKQLSPYEVSIDDNGSSAPPHLTNISSSSSSSSSFGNCNGNSNGDRTRVTKPSIRTRRSIRTRNNSSSSNSSSVVSFGTVTVREYERKLLDTTDCEYSNVNGNVNLGLAIGWEYMELEPIDVHSIPTKIYFAEAELTTEVERAKILLATGAYTKQELRSALESKNRRPRSGGKNNGNANNNNTDPLVDDNKKVASLKRVYKRPGRMIKRVSGKLSSLFISNDES